MHIYKEGRRHNNLPLYLFSHFLSAYLEAHCKGGEITICLCRSAARGAEGDTASLRPASSSAAEAGGGDSLSFLSISDSDPFCNLRNDCKVCCKYICFYSNNLIGRNYIKALCRSAVLALELEQVLVVSRRSTGSSGPGPLLLLWRAGSRLTGEWPSWDELVVLEETQDLQKAIARKRRQ